MSDNSYCATCSKDDKGGLCDRVFPKGEGQESICTISVEEGTHVFIKHVKINSMKNSKEKEIEKLSVYIKENGWFAFLWNLIF